MQTLLQDLLYGARILRKRPGFTLIAVITLALGIGANTAIFSLVNTALLRPLPVDQPDRLVSLNLVMSKGIQTFPVFSYPNYRDFRDRNKLLSGMLAYKLAPVSLSKDGLNERVFGYLASGNYFDVLGVRPALGRFFTPADDRKPGAHPVAVLTYDCWRKRFAGNPQIIGKTVIVNARDFTIIGVAPAGFYGTEISIRPELWFPIMMQAQIDARESDLDVRDDAAYCVQGRLKPGVTMAQAENELKIIASQLAREFPRENEGMDIALSPPGLLGLLLRGPVIGFAGVLMAMVGLVLLLACTNLANLLLARATERRKEIAVRLAIGASRRRLLRQLMTESFLLSALGGALGLLLAYWIKDAIMVFKPPIELPLSTETQIDGRVLFFTLIVSALTGLLFGFLPALQATRLDLVPALKDEVSLGGYRRSRVRNGLVVAQISLSLILLICAGLVLRGLQRAQLLDPGFTPQKALRVSFDLALQGYDGPRTRQFKRRLLERVRALPGVQYAGLSDFVPLSLGIRGETIHVEGQPEQRGVNAPGSMTAMASPDFVAALGTSLLEGRDFTEQDGESNKRVALVNETFAHSFWPGRSAVGKRFSTESSAGPWIEVVGVIKDGKYFTLGEDPTSFFYTNLLPQDGRNLNLVVRTASEPQSAIAAIRREIQQLAPALPVYHVNPLIEHISLSLFPARIAATLLGCFGLLALLLAAMGIFGVMSYAVTQRTREIGIRVALGAQAGEIFSLVIREGLKFIALGMGIGLACAIAGTRLISSFLYGVNALDLLTFIGVSLLLALVALLACYLPALRAMRVNPMVALRL